MPEHSIECLSILKEANADCRALWTYRHVVFTELNKEPLCRLYNRVLQTWKHTANNPYYQAYGDYVRFRLDGISHDDSSEFAKRDRF